VKQSKPARASGVHRAAELVREANARVHETAGHRDTVEGVELWHAALVELDAALRLLYPPALRDDIERLPTGDRGAIETAITFLEQDPWAFGTGYTKEQILGRLKKVELSPAHSARLRAVILDRVDGPFRREFRRYCRLAPRVADPSFRQALVDRLRAGDPDRRLRALWVLEALEERLTADERTFAILAIEDVAAGPFAWRVSGWLGGAVQRYADPAWIDDLVARAAERGKAGETALMLAGFAWSRLTLEQRARLDALAARAEWER
jgi:hypothetical protein